MADNAVVFPGAHQPNRGEPNESIIRMVDRIAEMAANGEIESIGFCIVASDKSVVTGVSNDGGSVFTLLGAVEHLKARVLDEIE